ncbi:recombinase family protein [Bacteroidales bacterium AH-315-N07]|nr:recombinase family protein [Bacteroidales bacterium AH-315-N07]
MPGALILEKVNNGLSFHKIAKELNEKGFRTAKGKKFQIIQVQRLFQRYKD